MISLFISTCLSLFVVIDVPGCAPIFASLTKNATPTEQRTMAIRAVLVSSGILVFFGFLGESFLRAVGIGLAAFRIAGGILVLLTAIEMVFEKRTQKREDRARQVKKIPEEAEDISVFPMAIPMIAGPGSIATIMLLISKTENWEQRITVFGALGAIQIMMVISLILAGPIMRVLGRRAEAMITRVLGLILAALAIQFILDGLKEFFHF
ncbi:MAG: MarC family protein [Zymomonas mobilis]|uniref:MarC family protein n=1 Tax=Zymomonas mobilis TaxID=542 RepID=UPI0039EA5F99